MGWLLKRGLALSRQGWRDDFNRPNENPIQPPWRQWGDSTSGRVLNNQLRLDNNGFLNWSVGGWGAEYQPLTPHWGYEFRADFANTANTGSFTVYLDKNWTRGQFQTSSQYQTYLTWQHDVDDKGTSDPADDTDSYGVTIVHKNKDAIFAALKDSYTMTQAQFFAAHTWKIDVFHDRAILVTMDGTPVLLYTVDDPDYYFSYDRRGLNFRSNAWDTDVDWFYVYDWLGFPFVWGPGAVSDDFNRANGPVGNGWTVLGDAQIVNNAYSMPGGFPSDGGRAILRTLGFTSGRVGIAGVLGGNMNPSAHEQGMVLCSNANGTQGLIARVTNTNAKLFRFSSALTGNPASYTQLGIFKNAIGGLSSGQQLNFEVYDGNAYIWRGPELLAFANNVHAVVPKTNEYMGLLVSRSAFINSGSWNSVQLYQIN